MEKLDVGSQAKTRNKGLSRVQKVKNGVYHALGATALIVGLSGCGGGGPNTGNNAGGNTPPTADTIAPIANADTFTTPFNTPKIGMDVITSSDTDNSGVTPTLTGTLLNPIGGTFVAHADTGLIDFTPDSTFSGVASVSYQIKDGATPANTATGTLTVNVDVAPAPSFSLTYDPIITNNGTTFTVAISNTGGVATVTGMTVSNVLVSDDANDTLTIHNGSWALYDAICTISGNIATCTFTRGHVFAPQRVLSIGSAYHNNTPGNYVINYTSPDNSTHQITIPGSF